MGVQVAHKSYKVDQHTSVNSSSGEFQPGSLRTHKY